MQFEFKHIRAFTLAEALADPAAVGWSFILTVSVGEVNTYLFRRDAKP